MLTGQEEAEPVGLTKVLRSMETDELIKHMRARVETCRRLANYVNDPRTTEALLQLADEGEADIRSLQAKEAARRH